MVQESGRLSELSMANKRAAGKITGDEILEEWARYILTSDYPHVSPMHNIQLYHGQHIDSGHHTGSIPSAALRWSDRVRRAHAIVIDGLDDDHRSIVVDVYIRGKTIAECANTRNVSRRTIDRKLELARFAVEVAIGSLNEMACAT